MKLKSLNWWYRLAAHESLSKNVSEPIWQFHWRVWRIWKESSGIQKRDPTCRLNPIAPLLTNSLTSFSTCTIHDKSIRYCFRYTSQAVESSSKLSPLKVQSSNWLLLYKQCTGDVFCVKPLNARLLVQSIPNPSTSVRSWATVTFKKHRKSTLTSAPEPLPGRVGDETATNKMQLQHFSMWELRAIYISEFFSRQTHTYNTPPHGWFLRTNNQRKIYLRPWPPRQCTSTLWPCCRYFSINCIASRICFTEGSKWSTHGSHNCWIPCGVLTHSLTQRENHRDRESRV